MEQLTKQLTIRKNGAQETELINKKKLKELLTADEIARVGNGAIVFVTKGGEKLGLNDKVEDTIIPLSPLQGG